MKSYVKCWKAKIESVQEVVKLNESMRKKQEILGKIKKKKLPITE